MAIQILLQPADISFAGDPIIVKAKTTLSGKTFLRVKLTVDASAYRSGEEYPYSEDYSYEVGTDGIAVFNIGNTVKTALERCMTCDVEGTVVSQTAYAVKYTLTYRESYIDGLQEIEEGETVSGQYRAVTGSLTEFERLTSRSEDTTSILGQGRILSRKPADEIIVMGTDLYIPAVYVQGDTLPYTIRQGEVRNSYSQYTGGSLVPVSLKISTSSLSQGNFYVDAAGETGKRKILTPEIPGMRHFLFLNGFGMLESVTAVMRESLAYDIESTLYSVPKDVDFRANTQAVNYADSPQATFGMSSGYVTRDWAEWFLSEFVVTRRAWMLESGRYLPVAIIPEESNELYDRSKPGLIAVNFSVMYSFLGGARNSFVV